MTNLPEYMGNDKMGGTVTKWVRIHWRPLLTHSLILSSFLLFCLFFSGPLFARFEGIDGECELQNVSLPDPAEGIVYNIDEVQGGTYAAEVRGWAYIDGQSSDNSEVYIVLKSDDKSYVFGTLPLAKAYNDLTIVSYRSGFVCNIPLSRIGDGKYVLGIYVKGGDTETLQFTDRLLVKSSSGLIDASSTA